MRSIQIDYENRDGGQLHDILYKKVDNKKIFGGIEINKLLRDCIEKNFMHKKVGKKLAQDRSSKVDQRLSYNSFIRRYLWR